MKDTLKAYIPYVVSEFTHKNPVYKIYWSREPHCKQTKMVIDIFGGISYRCKHQMEIINES